MTPVRTTTGINKTTRAGMAEGPIWPVLVVHEATVVVLEGSVGNGNGEPAGHLTDAWRLPMQTRSTRDL